MCDISELQMARLWVAIPVLLALSAVAAAADGPFEKEIRSFEASDRTRPPPRDAVLFIGSSSIKFWDTLADDFPDLVTIRRGFGGSQIADSTRYADRIIIPYHPRQIVLYAGDNDLAAGRTPRQVLEDFQAFVAKVRAELPKARISFISIKPSLARWKLIDRIKKANHLIEQYAASENGLQYLDTFTPMLGPDGKPRPELLRPDGLHCSRQGYQLWAKVIGPKVRGD